ncbi:MAG: hypothetical protein U0M81_08340 [Oscillospiraceae bacterium]
MKKLLATILALVMALSLCSVSWAAGLTTETDGVYHIKSGEELLAFAKMVNDDSKTFEGEKVVLDNDIDISTQEWTPIGERKTGGIKFKGTFDGQNKTITLKITNCTDYGALFEAIEGATVQNVTVAGTVSGKSVAGVVGQAGAGSKIINCTNKASVTGSSKAAGVVVKIEGNGVEVIGCKNEGSIGDEAPNGAAGIVTYAESANFIVKNCTNSGSISGKGASGIVYNVSDDGTGVVESCVNTGAVKSTSDSNAAAGIVAVNSKGNELTIKDCRNEGKIEGSLCSAISYNEFSNVSSAPNTNSGEIAATKSRSISESEATLDGNCALNLTVHPYAVLKISSGSYTGSIENKGSLTVNGGTFDANKNFINHNKLVINSGTFERDVRTENGKTTINGGELETDVTAEGGELTIAGGTFGGEVHAKAGGKVEIKGGKFTFNTTTNEVIDIQGDTSAVTISNGEFAQVSAARFCPHNENQLTVTGGIFTSEEMVTKLMGDAVNGPCATVVDGQNTMYAVGSAAIADAANSGKKVTITKGGEINGVNENVTVTVDADGVKINGKDAARGKYTVPVTPDPTPEQPPRYYYNSTTTTGTKADGTKGSPKTFDAGVGIYAVTAVLSVTGMAWTAKKREN